MFEMVHDLARPVEALRAAREALGPDGVVLVADEPVGDAYAGRGRRGRATLHGCSVLHCLPASMTEPGSAATGAGSRPDTVRRIRACTHDLPRRRGAAAIEARARRPTCCGPDAGRIGAPGLVAGRGRLRSVG